MEKQCKYVVKAVQLSKEGWNSFYLFKYNGRMTFTPNIQMATLFETEGEAVENLWKHNRGFRRMLKEAKANGRIGKQYKTLKNFRKCYMKNTIHTVVKLEVLNETNK